MKAIASKGKRKTGGQAAINAHAVRAVVQILFATGKPYTLETLRERLREFFVEEGDYEKRAVASMSAVQLITAILEARPQLEALGLQIRLTNGVAQIFPPTQNPLSKPTFLQSASPKTPEISSPTPILPPFSRLPSSHDQAPTPSALAQKQLPITQAGDNWRACSRFPVREASGQRQRSSI
jgi:hypothetical protein